MNIREQGIKMSRKGIKKDKKQARMKMNIARVKKLATTWPSHEGDDEVVTSGENNNQDIMKAIKSLNVDFLRKCMVCKQQLQR